jgi:hypothetical protein
VIVVRFVKSVVCVPVLVLAVVLGCGVSGASANSPWWHLTSGSRPGYLRAGVAANEVQRLTVSATKGEVVLADSSRLNQVFEELIEVIEGRRSRAELRFVAILPFGASAQQVQEQLQTKVFPSRRVLVTGGPGDKEGGKPYVITFPGQSVAPIYANGEVAAFLGGEGLSGGSAAASVSVSELSKGRPDGQLVVSAANLGDANAEGQTTVVDSLPAGLEAVDVEALAGIGAKVGDIGNAGQVECSLGSLSCVFAGRLPAYDEIEMLVGVVVREGAKSGEEANRASVTGGGAPGASVKRAITVSDQPTPFGVEDYELAPEEEGGAPDTQAGSHPFQLTTTLTLNQTLQVTTGRGLTSAGELVPLPAALDKDLRFKLPAGLIGNPTPFPQCTLKQFLSQGPYYEFENLCSTQTAVGVARITVNIPGLAERAYTAVEPIFNLEPSVGEPARFAFSVLGVPVYLDTGVRTGGDYGVTVTVANISQIAAFLRNEVTFWGVPSDPRHDAQRGWGCIDLGLELVRHAPCIPTEPHNPPPLLSLPTSCTGALQTSVETDSWLNPGGFLSFGGEPMQALDGCNRLPFAASVSVAPDGQAGSTPTGLTVGVHVPQEEALNGSGLSPSQVRDTVVALPAGVAINPAGADGLLACTEAQVALQSHTFPTCPDESKVGTVEVKSPLLPNALTGAVYLAAQNANPFGSLVALYLVFEDPVSGTLIKVAGEVKPDPVTGQLVSTFLDTPQLPFEDLKLHFFGGSRAPLSTPASCGSYMTVGSLAPWSGNAPVEPSSTFQITSGPNSSPCASPLPFSPELTAGSTNIQAGAFSPFTMTMSREDGNQNLDAIQLKMPPGLLGTLSSVKLCGEPQADQGTCGPESLIGETIVSVGLGGTPFTVKGGRVYITGPYEGAPYGLSIVNPAKAGPFDLGQVVVRAKIEVDPVTASLTVTTDRTGSFAIPQILDGIPLQIKHVNVTIDRRPGFTFNPTNCQPMAITGGLTSSQGAVQALSVPFQVTNCATLGFKPRFKVSTAGSTSRAKGASLDVKLSYPKAAWGSQANIRSVKVDLPKQLPSRLTTLQKACPDSMFNQDPASCPPGSRIGTATASTPIIPVSLSGPAYFVSHGGAKFPELVIVLSGYGVTVQLHGETFISKAGITSSTFRTIPDVPIGGFELVLPQGRDSALAANGNLCTAKKLAMPTSFVAQNGATIKQSTPINVTGCAKKAHRAKSKHKRK